MTDTSDADATGADTVTVMIGSFLDSGDVLTSGVVPALVASGAVGLDTLDYDMAAATYGGTYDDDLTSALAAAWKGSGSGTQEMSESSGVSAGTLALTNTTGATILLAAQGTEFTAGDGAVYQTIEQPTNAAWTNGTGQTGDGDYAIAPGQTAIVPIEATFIGDDAGSDPAGSITASPVAGLSVAQPDALTAGGTFTTSAGNTSGGWLTNKFGDYDFVYPGQGLQPAEAHVNVDASVSWSAADVASWDGYVANARGVGILNVAPLQSGALPMEDPAQPFATSGFYAGIRAAALDGGGLEIELPPWYWLHMSVTEQQTVLEEIRWCASEGLRSSLLVNSQIDVGGDPDPNFSADTVTMLHQMQANGALPSQVVLENDNATEIGSYYGTDPNSLNTVALVVADDFALTPSASEAGLEVRGTSAAQTTLEMTGVAPGLDVAGANEGAISPYANASVFGEDPGATLSLAVTDGAGLLALSDAVTGSQVGAGGTLDWTGTPAGATAFLEALQASAAPGTVGTAHLTLTLTDATGEVTAATTDIYLAHVHPTVASVTEAGDTVAGTLHAGAVVTFTVATSAPVTVAGGTPVLVLTNETLATYAGQDAAGDLLFRATIAAGENTGALRVRGLQPNGAAITDNGGLALDPDSIDGPEEAMRPLAVDTRTGTITGVTESVAGGAAAAVAGSTVLITLTADHPVASVTGTPTLQLNDGGVATYAGLTASGQVEFAYAVPTGGAWSGLAPASSDLGGGTLVNSLGEPVVPPYTLPAPVAAVSYDARAPGAAADTLAVALSTDDPGAGVQAVVTLDGVAIGPAVTVTADHASGQTQLVTLAGDWGSDTHGLGVALLGATAGSPADLRLDGATLDGVAVASPADLTAPGTLLMPVAPVDPDRLQLWVSEDAAGGNAQFTVAVDGTTLPGTYSTNASHAAGRWGEVDIDGRWGAGPHKVTVTFTNNAWTNGADRLLYVDGASMDGVFAPAQEGTLLASGCQATMAVPARAPGTLTLDVSEDAWEGDAQCYVAVDGTPYGGVTTVTASHAAGATQQITVADPALAAGAHTIGLAFINDAWGGTPSTDRNLYLDAVQFNGVDQHLHAALPTFGTASFAVGPGAATGITAAGAGSLLPGFVVTTSATVPSAAGPFAGMNEPAGGEGSTAFLLGR